MVYFSLCHPAKISHWWGDHYHCYMLLLFVVIRVLCLYWKSYEQNSYLFIFDIYSFIMYTYICLQYMYEYTNTLHWNVLVRNISVIKIRDEVMAWVKDAQCPYCSKPAFELLLLWWTVHAIISVENVLALCARNVTKHIFFFFLQK